MFDSSLLRFLLQNKTACFQLQNLMQMKADPIMKASLPRKSAYQPQVFLAVRLQSVLVQTKRVGFRNALALVPTSTQNASPHFHLIAYVNNFVYTRFCLLFDRFVGHLYVFVPISNLRLLVRLFESVLQASFFFFRTIMLFSYNRWQMKSNLEPL